MSNERAKLLTPEAKEMYSALYCLNLEVVPSIAEDVKAKVLAAVYAERQASHVAGLQAGRVAALEELAPRLVAAWLRYRELFGVDPHGTEKQMSALLALIPGAAIRALSSDNPLAESTTKEK